ncbi:ecto-NOX disulfide-thiol exchanger 2-like [Lineus longissimus]|uniref:ecto-NOX disulfide-thiol exchanger 2-like n=1 Tax=Lineus longissimus TaxID=88925 RepID=UPI002B4CD180
MSQQYPYMQGPGPMGHMHHQHHGGNMGGHGGMGHNHSGMAGGHVGIGGMIDVDPLTNNQPLQFNPNKGKPPMPIPGKGGDDMVLDDGSDPGDIPMNSMMKVDDQKAGQGNMQMGPGMMGMGYGPLNNMMGDPSMMMMGPMGFGQFGGYMGPGPMGPGGPMMGGPPGPPPPEYPDQRDPIKCDSCTLFPPPPGAPPRSTRERPLGCRTVFVGSLPEKMTEEAIREIFSHCGNIYSIRLSKKNFAHIRFESEEGVEQAISYSGWRLKVGDEEIEDRTNTSRVHVDYAQARDDQYEWECHQRQLAREHRHRQRMEEERLRPPSPPPIIHFSEHEAAMLVEHLKGDDTFMKATQVLMTWLERGDCNRRSANTFYSMVQSTNSHVRRLMNEKHSHEEELNIVKEKFKLRMNGILRQFEQIEKVFGAASKQKAWDHFSKAQRKNLDLWSKQAQEIKQQSQDEFLSDRKEDEMEMSDSEDGDPAPKKKKMDVGATTNQFHQLKEENDSLKCQLEAYRNEVDIAKHEVSDLVQQKTAHLKVLQHALHNTQQHLLEEKQKQQKDVEEIKNLKKTLAEKELQLQLQSQQKKQTEKGEENDIDKKDDSVKDLASTSDDTASASVGSSVRVEPVIVTSSGLTEKEARYVGVISTFLHVHPFGANIDYIHSFLMRLSIKIRSSEIEELLEKLPTVFKQDFHGVGASIEKRWKFIGFDI